MRQRYLSRRTPVPARIAPALIACLLTAGTGRSQDPPEPLRWDLMMIEEAPIWQYLLEEYRSADPYGSWAKRKEALQTILTEFPRSQWADDAALCLAGGLASFEDDLEGAIAELMQAINQYPDGSTVVAFWTPGRGAWLDEFWLRSRPEVSLNPDRSIRRSFPFDRSGDIPLQEREILAYWDHLQKEPNLTRDVAQLMIAWIYSAQGNVFDAIATLEALLSTSTPIAHFSKVDREAAAGADGHLIRYGSPLYGPSLWRPQYWAYRYLSYLYIEVGNVKQGIEVALEWLSTVSPDGWYWRQNQLWADTLAEHGYWEEAVAQYRIALEGIQQNIADEAARNEMREEIGEIGLPRNFTNWQENVEAEFIGTITRIEEALARAESHIPLPTSVTWEESAVTRGGPAFLLGPNVPNPFNASTVIRFSLPHSMEIRMTIVNLMGQEIRMLVEGYQEGGGQQVVWDGADQQGRPVASGLYLCRLTTKDLMATRKLVLLR